MLDLPEATVVGNVTITVSSTGTGVQIRSASTSSPASLSDTTLKLVMSKLCKQPSLDLRGVVLKLVP
jgi:hypothetical protein